MQLPMTRPRLLAISECHCEGCGVPSPRIIAVLLVKAALIVPGVRHSDGDRTTICYQLKIVCNLEGNLQNVVFPCTCCPSSWYWELMLESPRQVAAMPFLGGMHFENIAMVVQEIHVRVMDW